MEPVTVIGIDPGSVRTGWGVVRTSSSGYELVDCGLIKTTTGPEKDFCQRLAVIYHELVGILARTKPQEAAIEQVFMSRNAATAFKLGQARGVAVAACAAHGLHVLDYEPSLVKKTLVGTGGAEKEQVAFMVRCRLGVRASDWPLDTSDALAIALTHLSLRRFRQMTQIAKSGR